jgi:hypothetical protein
VFTTVVGEAAVVVGCFESTTRTAGVVSPPLVSTPIPASGSAITAAIATAARPRRRCRTSADDAAFTCRAAVRSSAAVAGTVVAGFTTTISVDGPVVPGSVAGSSPADRSTLAPHRIASNALGKAREASGL